LDDENRSVRRRGILKQ